MKDSNVKGIGLWFGFTFFEIFNFLGFLQILGFDMFGNFDVLACFLWHNTNGFYTHIGFQISFKNSASLTDLPFTVLEII